MNQTGAADVEESLEYAGTTTEQPIVSFFARAIFRERSPTIINTIPLGVVLLFEKWLCFVTEDRDEPGATHLAKELGRAVLPVIGKEVLRGLTGITGNAVDLTTKIFRKLNPNDPDDVDIREELNSTNSFVIPAIPDWSQNALKQRSKEFTFRKLFLKFSLKPMASAIFLYFL